MGGVFTKDVLRSVTHSLGRFLAIACIVALGCGFYAGLRMTGPDMRTNLDAFTDGTNLYDIRVVSTLGINDDMVQAVEETEGVSAVSTQKTTDVMAAQGEQQLAVRVATMDFDAARQSTCDNGIVVQSSDDSYMNRPILAEGTWPTSDDECVLSADRVSDTPAKVGDLIKVEYGTIDLDEVLVERTFKVVGLVHSSAYISSSSMGSTTLGSGTIQQYAYVPEGAFDADFPASQIFLTVEGAKQESATSDAYLQKVDAVMQKLEAQADRLAADRTASLKDEAQRTVDEKRAEYDEAKADADTQLAEGRKKLDDAAATIEENQKTLDDSQAQYDDGLAQLNAAIDEYNQGAAQYDQANQQLQDQAAQLQSRSAAAAASGIQPTAAQQQQAAAAQQQLQAAQSELAAQKQQLDAAYAQIEATRKQLQEAADKLEQGKLDLQAGRDDLAEGRATYDRESADAQKKLDDAKVKLDDAQKTIDDIESAEVYVMDRTKNAGVESFKSDAGRVDNIATVFPLIFFLVAALVALTTMTRMVDEDRILIGTYKALGYGRARITGKYLFYAAAASTVGAVVGIAVLCQVLPFVICVAYAIIYNVPQAPLPLGYDPGLVALSFGMGVGITLIATWGAAAATLREQPAALMLPRAPKAGKRILLERIGPLWRHLSFSWKVTCRNIFRYKKRFFMTVIGIGGCTALLLTGLGLSNSINDIIDKHFGVILRYNTEITVADNGDASQRDEVAAVEKYLMDSGYETHMAGAYSETCFVTAEGDGKDYDVSLICPSDAQEFAPLMLMRDRVTQQPVTWDDNSVVITEKLATSLGASVGDTVRFYEQDDIGNITGQGYPVVITGIMENYVYNYAYFGPKAYEVAYGHAPTINRVFAAVDATAEQREVLADGLRAMDEVETVAFNDETIETYRKMLKSVDMIVVVLVVSAAALAFIVLYNLTNINITERRREIASLKVLGFTRRETDLYIFREIMLLTLVGAALGLVLGVFMESFVVVSAEVNQVMFGREIHVLSFVWAYLITVLFAAVVMLFMRRKLDKVDMVESLKSIE